MVVIINKSVVTDNLIKNKDARSESVDSFSSTIDVHHHKDAPFKKHPANVNVNDDDEDDYSSPPSASVSVSPPRRQFDLAIKDIVSKEIQQQQQQQQQHNADALSSILVLDSPSRPAVRTLLETYNGHLTDVGPHMLEGLRNASPSRLAARVGDYNENLFYEMRDGDMDVASIISQGSISGGSGGRCDDDCGSSEEEKSTSSSSSSSSSAHHLDSQILNDIASFEDSIRESLQCTKVKYRGSFMQTERTMYQPAHVDYDYPILQEYGKRLFLAFFPLTEEGAFLQLWQDDYDDPTTTATASTTTTAEEEEEVRSKKYEGKKTATIIQEGTVVYIPRGKMFIVPSDTIHGGGFKRGHGGNLRFHLYIDVEDDANKGIEGAAAVVEEDDDDGAQRRRKMKETNDIALLDHPMNKYTERHDRRRELCERFVDAEGLEGLLGTFFDI